MIGYQNNPENLASDSDHAGAQLPSQKVLQPGNVEHTAPHYPTAPHYSTGNPNPMLYDPLPNDALRSSKLMQVVAALTVCFTTGLSLAWATTVRADADFYVDADLNHINKHSYWIRTVLLFGTFCGALPAAYIADAIGRRYAALLMEIPLIIAYICMDCFNSLKLLYIARFLVGIATGGFYVIVPLYLSEIAETRIRGALGTLFALMLTVGTRLVYLLDDMLSSFELGCICLLLLFGMLLLPETPTFLLRKARVDNAAKSMKWLYGRNFNSGIAIENLQSEQHCSPMDNNSILNLFSNRLADKALIICSMLMLFQQFSGLMPVLYYMEQFCSMPSWSEIRSNCLLILSVAQIAMTLLSTFLIELVGRKPLLLFSSSIMAICLAAIAVCFQALSDGLDSETLRWLCFICFVAFNASFSVGYGPIPWLMPGELFTPNVRAKAIALATMINWLAFFVVSECFSVVTNSSLLLVYSFWFLACCMLLATICVSVFLTETRGKSTTQIQALLRNIAL